MNIINLEGGGFSPQSPSPGSAPGSVNHGHTYTMNCHLRDIHVHVRDMHVRVRVRDMHVRVRDMHVRVRDMHVRVRDIHVHVHISRIQAFPVLPPRQNPVKHN